MATPKPFKIAIADSFLEQTRQKLLNARLPDQLLDTTWEGTSNPQDPSPKIPFLLDFSPSVVVSLSFLSLQSLSLNTADNIQTARPFPKSNVSAPTG